VRYYADGAARITVGDRASTLAVLSALGKAPPTVQVR
jgi:histidinol-phosphate aminotransferase